MVNEEQVEQYLVKKAPGRIFYLPNWCSEEEEARLLAVFAAAPRPKWKELARRRLINYGGVVGRKGLLAVDDFPTELLAVMRRVDDLAGHTTNHALVNEYRRGEGILPHTDGPAFQPIIATLSLGNIPSSTFTSRKREERRKLEKEKPSTGTRSRSFKVDRRLGSLLLERRSLVVITGDAYSKLLHGIEEREDDVIDERVWNAKEEERGRKMERSTRLSITMRRVEKVRSLAETAAGRLLLPSRWA